MRRLLLFLLLVPSLAHAANTWSKLTPPTSSRRFPAHWTDCSPSVTSGNPVARSYSSMVNGPSGKILFWGGGHASHPGNDAELFDTATSTWTEQYVPECLDACCRICSNNLSTTCFTSADCVSPGTCSAASSSMCGNELARCPIAVLADPSCMCNIANGGDTTTLTPLGRPYVGHSYQAYAYNPNASRQRYLVSTRSGVWSYLPPTTWTLLTTTQPSLPVNPWGASKLLIYDPTITCGPDTGAILMFANPGYANGGIYCFNYATNHWDSWDTSGTAFPTGFHGYEMTATFDTSRNEIIISGGGNGTVDNPSGGQYKWDGIWRYSASTKTWTNTNVPTAALQSFDPSVSTAIAYDAVHDITLALKPTVGLPVDMWQYNNATGVWADVDDTQLGTLPANRASGPPGSTVAQRNLWRWDAAASAFYLLAQASVGSDGGGGGPDDPNWGTTTWKFQWDNPLIVGAATATMTPTGPTATRTSTPTITPTRTITLTPTPTPSLPGYTPTNGPGMTWAQRIAQPGVLAAVGFHNSTEVAAYRNVSPLTSNGPVYDATMNAADFPIILALPTTQYNEYDGTNGTSPYGGLTFSLPWSQQFDAGDEFEVQYLVRDDDWVTELTNKKLDIWGAGDRNPSDPPQGSGTTCPTCVGPLTSGSCMPDDVVTEFDSRIGSAPGALHLGVLSGYQGCSSGPAWGNSYAGQIGVDFADFVPSHGGDHWFQPAKPSCLGSRIYNETIDPAPGAQMCTILGANVWEAVTMHFKFGARGYGPFAGYPLWQANHVYGAAFITDSNGNIQRTYSGGTSGTTEPSWPTYSTSDSVHNTTTDGTVVWNFWGGAHDWLTNSYFWLAFGWEGRPSTALIYRGPFSYYSPISDLSYGDPPPKVGKLHLFPYRQACFDSMSYASKTANTLAGVASDGVTETYPIGSVVTDANTAYTTLTAAAHVGDTTLHVASTTNFASSGTLHLWRTLKSGHRWYKEMLIATGSSLGDPFGADPIVWPTPPNSADAWPGGVYQSPSGEVPSAPVTPGVLVLPTPPVLQ